VHVLCLGQDSSEVTARLLHLPGVTNVLRATPGSAAVLIT